MTEIEAQVVFTYFCGAVELLFCLAIGLAVLPDSLVKQNGGKDKLVYFLISPLVGFTVWMLSINFLSMSLQFNRAMSVAVLAGLGGFVIWQRKKLYMITDKYCLSFMASTMFFSVVLIYDVYPYLLDGGLYFPISAHDHSRIAMVDSLVKNGFPLYSPWVTDNGNLVPTAYHFGIHVLMAQLVSAFNTDCLFTCTTVVGLTCSITMMTLGAITVWLSGNSKSLMFLLLLCASDKFEKGIVHPFVELFVKNSLSFGFWSFVNNAIWGPHHIVAAVMVILAIFSFDKMLDSKEKIDKWKFAFIIGTSVAASVHCSVYSGGFAAALLAVVALIMCVCDKDFRSEVYQHLLYIGGAIIIAVGLSAVFLRYLLKYSGASASLGWGIMPQIKFDGGLLAVIPLIFLVYLVLFPIRFGMGYIFGTIACLMSRVLPNIRFVKLCKYYILFIMALIFVVHSSIYSNDFGWRVSNPAFFLLMCFGAVLLLQIYERLKIKAKPAAYLFAALLIAVDAYFITGTIDLIFFGPDANTHEEHKEYAEVIDGWRVIRENTNEQDFVLSNPDTYGDFNPPLGDVVGNYHFSYFARRYSPMGDYSYAKTSGVRMGVDRVIKLHDAIAKFFAGGPSAEEVAYIADVQKVKAILVTPRDGLYTNEGALRTKYPRLVSGPHYKVYLTK